MSSSQPPGHDQNDQHRRDQHHDNQHQHQQYHPTYRAGEETQRLRQQAYEFGLDQARVSRQPQRGILRGRRRQHNNNNDDTVSSSSSSVWKDHTFSAAMMHSVGSLANDEYIDETGQIHQLSIRLRRRRRNQQQQQMTVGADGDYLEQQQQLQTQTRSQPDYGTLQNLFDTPTTTATTTTTAITTGDVLQLPPTRSDKLLQLDDDDHKNKIVSDTEDNDNEFEVEDQVEGGSMTAAIFGIVKGTIGPAILYLPRGFRMAGWAIAIPSLIVATFAYIYSAHCLLACWKVEDTHQRLLASRMEEFHHLLENADGRNNDDNVEGRREQQEQEQEAIDIENKNSNNNHNDDDDDDMPSSPLVGPSDSSTTDAVQQQQQQERKEMLDNTTSSFTPKLLTYPELARRAFGSFAFMIEFGIASMQFGVCLTYLIFVPSNLLACYQTIFGNGTTTIETTIVDDDNDNDSIKLYFLVIMLLIEIPCCWIRDIRKLTPFNVVATLLIAYGLVSCLVIAAVTATMSSTSSSSSSSSSNTWPTTEENDGYRDETVSTSSSLPAIQPTWYLFLGTAFFVFEGSITLVVPLQEAVYKAEDRERFPMVNQHVTTTIVIFYIGFAMSCWAAFGDNVQTAMTASLPPGIFSTTVQFGYAVAVILTYPLQAYPAMEVTLRKLTTTPTGTGNNDSKDSITRSKMMILRRNVASTVLNLLLGVIAVVAIDYLGNVVSLLGSLVGMPIALVYPPLMHNILVKKLPRPRRYMNYVVSGIGLFATVSSILDYWLLLRDTMDHPTIL